MISLPRLCRSVLLAPLCGAATAAEQFPPPKFPGDPAAFGRGIQRTIGLLAESTPERRHTVRVLFYGQSITEQGWWKIVADDLRARFPHANLVIENRALGGFSSQLLVKTAETDLYPFQPDLLIFHVFGAHDKYEDIIRRVRERTCAEILLQNDHLGAKDRIDEETDPAKNPINGKAWSGFMNFNWLPKIAAKYGTGLCDQRTAWKAYLRDYGLEPQALLKDGVHLNARGEFLMAEIVKAHLQHRPELGPAAADAWVKTLVVGKDVSWAEGKLRAQFEGNRVDVVTKPAGEWKSLTVRIDDKKPSELPELYGFTRAQAKPGGKWPPIAPISSEAPLLLEDWTMEVQRDAANEKLFTFKLTGSKTGADGEGRSDARFVSNSRRIVIAPDDWNVAYALGLVGIKPPPQKFTVRWSVVPHYRDELKIGPGEGSVVTLASGLANTKHSLEITGDAAAPITAIRIYRPPLGRK